MNVRRLSEVEVEETVVRLKEGDLDARDRLIEAFVPLVKSIAYRYAKKYPYLRDELVTCALENLTYKVNRIWEGKALPYNNNVAPYLNSTTCYAMRNCIARYLRHRDKVIPAQQGYVNDTPFLVLVDEVLSSEEFNDQEKRIIQMRLEGYTDDEIAADFRVSRQWVSLLRSGLRERLEQFV
jgi:DNA-directed RNA polymerase specialized sigma subunit